MRKHNSSLSSNAAIVDCTRTNSTSCVNTERNSLKVGQSHTVRSCTFNSISSSISSGGCLFLSQNTTSPSSSLLVEGCTFNICNVTEKKTYSSGGGAIYIDCGTLSVSSSVFIACKSKKYGGAILAETHCECSTVSLCVFISCEADNGAGLMNHDGPISSVSSCRFFSCIASVSGGGLYYDCEKETTSFTVTDSLFKDNRADYTYESLFINRGGGAFEDFRTKSYSSRYSFSFFRENSAPSGVGQDISIHTKTLSLDNIIECFTTTPAKSLWNVNQNVTNWLPQGSISFPNWILFKKTSTI